MVFTSLQNFHLLKPIHHFTQEEMIYFSGTTAPDNSPYVTIVIYDHNNKFVLL